ncbi:CelD/BcsL family acetyltransferase involved in cellulose biosynthesis [Novosphingobium kunmingense]|uniref:CelD/BcsL family acetyltransferase involved in cellulose biosynthesis n=1 Tax=Novosphingobium kunmingense TaxID=1211806 RepID=A0A2N0I342_9SPHN|nr:CelD/BcsL family acetyltransferase involved in cellulose biosynthesis [Novosphingobium kunmingense]
MELPGGIGVIVVTYHDDLGEVQGDPALAALLAAPRALTPFDRLEWWRNLADTCGLQPLIAVSSNGVDRFVLPLMRMGRELAGLQNWYTFRLAAVSSTTPPRDDLAGALAWDLTARTGRVVLEKLGKDDAIVLQSAFRRAGWMVWCDQVDTNHRLQVGGRGFPQYLRGRAGNLRTTLKRKSGKLKIRMFRNFDNQSYELYENIYRESWKPPEGSPAFLRRFAEEEGAAGRLLMGLAFDGDRPVAAQLWSVENGTAFIHKLAHLDDAGHLSPGSVLTAALLEEVIDRDKVAEVDFGTGNDPFKRDWMNMQRPLFRLDIVRPLRPGNWPIIARHALRRAAGRG